MYLLFTPVTLIWDIDMLKIAQVILDNCSNAILLLAECQIEDSDHLPKKEVYLGSHSTEQRNLTAHPAVFRRIPKPPRQNMIPDSKCCKIRTRESTRSRVCKYHQLCCVSSCCILGGH